MSIIMEGQHKIFTNNVGVGHERIMYHVFYQIYGLPCNMEKKCLVADFQDLI